MLFICVIVVLPVMYQQLLFLGAVSRPDTASIRFMYCEYHYHVPTVQDFDTAFCLIVFVFMKNIMATTFAVVAIACFFSYESPRVAIAVFGISGSWC